jgi:uncharacterized protein
MVAARSTFEERDHVQVIRDYMAAQEQLDAEATLRYLADDAVIEFPYALPGMAPRVEGAEGLRAHSGLLPQFMRTFSYSDTTIEPMAAPGRFFVDTLVRAELLREGAAPYENRYAIVAEVVDGRITYWREYFGAVQIGELLAAMAG